MKKIFLLLWLGISLIVSAQQTEGLHFQWHQFGVANNQTRYDFKKDTFISICKVGYNVKNNNVIAVLDPNSGFNLGYYKSPISYSQLFSIRMKNVKHGVIFSSDTNFYITTDGWKTYTKMNVTQLPYGNTGSGYYAHEGNSLKFSPDAINWSTVLKSTGYLAISHGTKNVFATTGNKMYTSANGGASFDSMISTNDFSKGKLYPANDDTLFIVGTKYFQRSYNAGITWESDTLPIDELVTEAACRNGKEIMVRFTKGFTNYVYYSKNSGNTWTYLTTPVFPTGSYLTASNANFLIYPAYKSKDGSAWPDIFPRVPKQAFDINFTGNIGLAGLQAGYVSVSENKGLGFKIFNTPLTSEDIMAVKVLSNGKFIIGDRKGQIFESINKGITWNQRYTSASNINARKILYSEDCNIILCVRLGQPLVSVNGGLKYDIYTAGGGQHHQTMKPKTGEIVDAGGMYPGPTYELAGWEFSILSSSGKTPISSFAPSTVLKENIVAIEMADDNTGYFITYNSSTYDTYIYKTTDGWKTVNLVSTIPSVNNLLTYASLSGKLQFWGKDSIILSGIGNGLITSTAYYHYSTNGGVLWQKVNTDFSFPDGNLGNSVYKTHFFNFNENISLIYNNSGGGASAGAYLKLNAVSGSQSTSVNDPGFLKSVKSFNIYPNPVNSSFVIHSSHVLDNAGIHIYNDLGQSIFSQYAVNGDSFDINVENLSGGIYFIQIMEKGVIMHNRFIKQ